MALRPVVSIGIIVAALAVPSGIFAGGFQSQIQEKIKNTRFGQQANEAYYGTALKDAEYEADMILSVSEAKEIAAAKPPRDRKDAAVETGLRKEESARKAKSRQNTPAIFSPYLIYRTDYKADIEDDVVTVKGNILFEVFLKGWTQIPLVASNAGLIDVRLSRGNAFVKVQDGMYVVLIDRPGKYSLDMEFLIKAARERENGPGSFSLQVVPAPISQFESSIADERVEIFVEPSLKTEVRREAKKTIAWAVMPNTSTVSVRWTKALPKETIAPAVLEPKVYADTTTYAAIGDGVIRCRSALSYSILQAEVPGFRVALPADATVLNVSGNELRDWKTTQSEGVQYIDVYLNFGVKGTYVLNIAYERKVAPGTGVAQVPWVRAMNAEREQGYFGIAAATNVELAVHKAERVSAIDVKELPSVIWGSTTSPILLAFKYLSHPFDIRIDVTRHEEVPVLIAAIDSVRYTTLQTDEGKSLTRAVYNVRNNVKQFLRVKLPPQAALWSVFVAGKPVKPAKDKNGAILIPLEKSQMSGESLTQFPVEVVYLASTVRMRTFGQLSLELPNVDIPASSLQWDLYMPREYSCMFFGGDVKESGAGFAGGRREMRPQSPAVSQGMLSAGGYATQQYEPYYLQADMDSRDKGVLPIKIDVPQQGRLLQFSKLLVTEQESPRLSCIYYYRFPKAAGATRFLIFIGLCVLAAAGIMKLLAGRFHK